MFYVFCAKLVLDDLFPHLFQFVVRIGALSHSKRSSQTYERFLFRLSAPRSLLPNAYLLKLLLKMTSVWCVRMRVFFLLLILLCQLIGYVFLFFSIFFTEEQTKTYRKYEKGDEDEINIQKKNMEVSEQDLTILRSYDIYYYFALEFFNYLRQNHTL